MDRSNSKRRAIERIVQLLPNRGSQSRTAVDLVDPLTIIIRDITQYLCDFLELRHIIRCTRVSRLWRAKFKELLKQKSQLFLVHYIPQHSLEGSLSSSKVTVVNALDEKQICWDMFWNPLRYGFTERHAECINRCIATPPSIKLRFLPGDLYDELWRRNAWLQINLLEPHKPLDIFDKDGSSSSSPLLDFAVLSMRVTNVAIPLTYAAMLIRCPDIVTFQKDYCQHPNKFSHLIPDQHKKEWLSDLAIKQQEQQRSGSIQDENDKKKDTTTIVTADLMIHPRDTRIEIVPITSAVDLIP